MSRRNELGALGKSLAEEVLHAAGFTGIGPISCKPAALADFKAQREGSIYLVKVVTRNRFTQQGNPEENPSYNLVRRQHVEAIQLLEKTHVGTLAWVAIQVEPLDGVFSAFFGTWDQVGRNRLSIPMQEEDTDGYERLANRQPDERITPDLAND